MGFVDLGNQIKSFTFKQEATSPGFNKINVGVVKPGLYKGGKVFLRQNLGDPTVNPQWVIKPMVLALESRDLQNREILVNLITTSDVTLSAFVGGVFVPTNDTQEDRVIVARFDWLNVINNFADFLIKPLTQVDNRDVIICRLVGQGNNNTTPPIVTYDLTTYGDGYDGLDERDLPNTNEGEIGNNRQIRINGDYFRLRLSNHNPDIDNNVSPQSELVLPRIAGSIELIEEYKPENKIKAYFHIDKENLKKANIDKLPNSAFNIQYTAGFPINTQPPTMNNCLNIFQDDRERIRIRNSTGQEIVFNCRISSNNYRQVF
jgi:hypothetical protein